jgi:hypothetical protein
MVWPNPVTEGDELTFRIEGGAPGGTKVTLHTVSYRQLAQWDLDPVYGPVGDWRIKLLDYSGKRLSNGLYYLAFHRSGVVQIRKVMVLR